MELIVERDFYVEEKSKGIFGGGKEKNRVFVLKVKLNDVSEELKQDLKDYNYTSVRGSSGNEKVEKKDFFTKQIKLYDEEEFELGPVLHKKNLIVGEQSITIKDLIKGCQWNSEGLYDAFCLIPEIITNEVNNILSQVKAQKNWTGEKQVELKSFLSNGS